MQYHPHHHHHHHGFVNDNFVAFQTTYTSNHFSATKHFFEIVKVFGYIQKHQSSFLQELESLWDQYSIHERGLCFPRTIFHWRENIMLNHYLASFFIQDFYLLRSSRHGFLTCIIFCLRFFENDMESFSAFAENYQTMISPSLNTTNIRFLRYYENQRTEMAHLFLLKDKSSSKILTNYIASLFAAYAINDHENQEQRIYEDVVSIITLLDHDNISFADSVAEFFELTSGYSKRNVVEMMVFNCRGIVCNRNPMTMIWTDVVLSSFALLKEEMYYINFVFVAVFCQWRHVAWYVPWMNEKFNERFLLRRFVDLFIDKRDDDDDDDEDDNQENNDHDYQTKVMLRMMRETISSKDANDCVGMGIWSFVYPMKFTSLSSSSSSSSSCPTILMASKRYFTKDYIENVIRETATCPELCERQKDDDKGCQI